MLRNALVLIVLVAGSFACSTVSAPVPSATVHGVPSGWQVVSRQGTSNVSGIDKSTGEGFRIALPPSWIIREVDRARMLDRFKTAWTSDPARAGSYTEAEGLKWVDSYKLLATGGTGGADPVSTELQIRSVWIDAAVNLARFENDQRGSYERELGATLVSSKRTQLGTQEAQVVHLRYGSRDRQVWLTVFLLVRARELWTIEFYAPFDGIDRLAPIIDEVAATFLFI